MSASAAGLRSRRGFARVAAIPESRLAAAAFALIALLGTIHLYRKGVGTNFFYDEWDFVQFRHGGGLSTLLEPHNEHLSLAPIVVYKLLFATFGLDQYGAFRLVALLLHATLAGLLFAFARPRVGGWLALAAAALLLFLGAGYDDVLWPFQIGYLLSLTSGLAALLLLERGSRAGDVGAMCAIALSISSSGLGIPVAVGAFAYILWGGGSWRRLWVVAAPLALYALWYLGYGEGTVRRENLTEVPSYGAEEVAGAVGGVAGLPIEWGRTLAIAAVGALIWRVSRLSRVGPLAKSFAMVLAVALAFWGLNALARAHLNEPAAPRYVYVGGLFVLLIAVEALRGWRPSRLGLGLVAAGTLLAVVSGLGAFHDGSVLLRKHDQVVTAQLTALEIGAGRMPAGFEPNPDLAPQLAAGPYIDAVRSVGSSPAFSERELRGVDDARLRLVDGVFTRGYGLRLAPAAPGLRPQGPAPVADQPAEAAVATRGSCLTAAPGGGGPVTLTFTAPPGGFSLRAPGAQSVALRRFSTAFGDPLPGSAASGALLRIPSDASSRPWQVLVSKARSVRACGLGGGP